MCYIAKFSGDLKVAKFILTMQNGVTWGKLSFGGLLDESSKHKLLDSYKRQATHRVHQASKSMQTQRPRQGEGERG